MPIHAVFSRHLGALREMVDFLIPCKRLIELTLDIGASPLDRPFLVSVGSLSESIVFEGVSDERNNDAVVEFEVVALILGLVRADADGINIGSEYQVLLLRYVRNALWGCLSCFI